MEQHRSDTRPSYGAPELSAVISTYNRCDLLPAAVESVLAQESGSPDFELIVVDNNSADGTRATVEALAARADGRLRYVFEPKQGLAHARNAGIASARGRIIAFTDDDVRVAPDWVRNIKHALDTHPDADFVGGKVLPRWPAEPPRWLTDEHWSPLAVTDYGDVPFYVDRRRPACLVGANLAFRREVFERFGLFDPAYQHEPGAVSAVEDHELELRLWRAGRRGLYAPEISITAEVQPDRLTKRYHRKWHLQHGWKIAQLHGDDIYIEPDGSLAPQAPSEVRLFGTPAWMYRQLLVSVAQGVLSAVRGQTSSALWYENLVREDVGYIRYRYRRHRRESDRSHAAEVSVFARELLRKKRRRAPPAS